jgi:GTP diphosphokinase / guanosine-3',5'-bis(diphosphate) 3'-diphosphatase
MIRIKPMLNESSLVDKAREFAKKEHLDVKRRISGLDYFVHPHSVARMAKSMGLSEDEQILAYLHDVVEDSKNKNETLEKINTIFGNNIVKLVLLITHDKLENYFSYVLKIAKQNKNVLRIKILDMYSNIIDNPSEHQKLKYINALKYLLQNNINEPLIKIILNKINE